MFCFGFSFFRLINWVLYIILGVLVLKGVEFFFALKYYILIKRLVVFNLLKYSMTGSVVGIIMQTEQKSG